MRRRDFIRAASGLLVPSARAQMGPLIHSGPGPMVAFTFDDINASDYTQAFPQFQSRGVNGTSFAITNRFDENAALHLTVAQALEMQAAGWEFGSHTDTHPDLTGVDAAQLTRELRDSRHFMQGIGLNVANIAYPQGLNNAAVQTEAAKWYRTGRGVAYGYETRSLNRYTLKIQALPKGTALATGQGFVNAAKASRSLLILVTHDIAASDAAVIGDLIDYALGLGVPVVPLQTALTRLGGPSTPALAETGNLFIAPQDMTDANYWSGQQFSATADAVDAPAEVGGKADLLQPSGTNAKCLQRVLLKPNTQYTYSVYIRVAAGGGFTLTLSANNLGLTGTQATGNVSASSLQFNRHTLTFNTGAYSWLRVGIGGFNTWSTGRDLWVAGAMINEGATALPYVPGIA